MIETIERLGRFGQQQETEMKVTARLKPTRPVIYYICFS